MKKKEPNDTLVEKLATKISDLIEKLKTVDQKIVALRADIHREIVTDGIVWNPNVPFENMVEYHRQVLRGRGDAQFLAGKLPELIEEALKIHGEIKQLIEEITEPCNVLVSALNENLREALNHNLAAVTQAIRSLCLDENEATGLAESFSAVADIRDRLPVNLALNRAFDSAVFSAMQLVRNFRQPIRRLAGAEGKVK